MVTTTFLESMVHHELAQNKRKHVLIVEKISP